MEGIFEAMRDVDKDKFLESLGKVELSYKNYVEICRYMFIEDKFEFSDLLPIVKYPSYSCIPLIVATASYSEDKKRVELYSRMKESFLRIGCEPTFLLACSGEGWKDEEYTYYSPEKTSQFVAFKQMFENLDSHLFDENAILIMMDDDDTIQHLPLELVRMHEDTSIRALKSNQGIPLSEDETSFIDIPLNADFEKIDRIFPFLTSGEDFSGHCIRWKECVEFMTNLRISRIKLLNDMLDISFMDFCNTLPHIKPDLPFVYRSPASMSWI